MKEQIEEEWREIYEFPFCQVSNTGKVRTRIAYKRGSKGIFIIENEYTEVCPTMISYPYSVIYLTDYYSGTPYNSTIYGPCRYGCKRKYVSSLGKLVADEFIPNYFHGKRIKHIDGDANNNCVSNLKWESCDIPIIARNLLTGEEMIFANCNEIEDAIGVPKNNVRQVLYTAHAKSAYKWTFELVDESRLDIFF